MTAASADEKTSSSAQIAVILAAAGSSTRFGTGTNKILQRLGNMTVLERTAFSFLRRIDVGVLIIATADVQAIAAALGEIAQDTRVKIVPGGSCRALSVKAALAHVPAEMEWIAIHDGARPLVTSKLIDQVITAAMLHGAAAPALAVHLTVKEAVGPLPAAVEKTVPRHTLWAMQTPQVMRRSDLLTAFSNCPIPLEQITDDLQLLELAGKPTWLVAGEERNLKITTPIDLQLAEQILRESAKA